MNRALCLLIPGLLLAACRGDQVQEVETCYPVMATSVGTLDFGALAWGQSETKRLWLSNEGDLPMGVGEITLNVDEMEENWAISYDFVNVSCPGGQGGDGGTSDGGAGDGGSSDGGSSDGGSGDSGGGETGVAMGAPVPASMVDTGGWGGDGGGIDVADRILPPGCKLPIEVTLKPERVGGIYGSITIESVTQDNVGEDEEQLYWSDPNTAFTTVLLSGEGDKGAPNIYVSPRALDFGTVWEGDDLTLLVDVANTGDGDLELGAPYLDATCEEGFSIDWSWGTESVLPGDGLTGVEVTFTPLDDSGVTCVLWVPSNDPDEPQVDVPMQGNVGTDPEECKPTVTIVTPTVGHEHLNGQDLDMVFEVWDCNQPADTLKLSIRSGVLNTETPTLVETFYAPDESGYVEAKVPRDLLGRGTDTIIVRAIDSAGNYTDAATTVLFRTTFPASDDDGDGYGTDGETAIDCDDGDVNSFPAAMERYDGQDNDCDDVIDEGTEGTDDDGDGFSEVGGDCDDNDADTYPGAEETPDYRDNDCDGLVDENTTLADDDEDGYSEAEGDCDDGDEMISPTATEFCDGVDNDCNGLSDERDGCVDLDSDPLIIGCIRADRTTISVGEQVALKTFVFDGDGDLTSYSWQQDSKLTAQGYNGLDNLASASVTFTAPATIEGNKDKETYTFAVQVADPGMNVDFCNIDITVLAEAAGECTVDEITVKDGCGSGSSALLVPGAFGLLMFARRRRERGPQA